MANNQPNEIFDFNSGSYLDYRCGANKFSDLLWDFNGYVDKPSLSGKRLVIDYSSLSHNVSILEVVKFYMISQLTNNDISTAKRNFDGVIRFNKYLTEYFPEINSFVEINEEVLTSYFEYLVNDAKSETTNKPLGKNAITKAALPIKDILIKGKIRGWNVPENTQFVKPLYDTYILNNKVLKNKEKKSKKRAEAKVSNRELVDKVLKTALNDLREDRNILVTAAIIITSQIGLRISEIANLQIDCLKEIDGDVLIECPTKKLHKENINTMKPTNSMVVLAVQKVEQQTKALRKETDLTNLFLTRNRSKKGTPPTTISVPNWNKNFLRPWIKLHNLVDQDGNYIDLNSHSFRHAFATYALNSGASIEVISELLNHKSIRGTLHYTHLLQDQVKNNFAKVLSEGAIISGKKALQIKDKLKSDNPFKGKTTEQVDKMRKAMKIEVLPHGLCLHHPMRNEPCEGDGVCLGCHNYVTTPEFLDVHKERLKNVQNELSKVSAEGPFEKKLKNMERYLINIIQELESELKYKGSQDNAEYTIN